MKLYISCDMEGTAGVATWTQCDPKNTTEYPIYRRLMGQEVRAAIDAARAAGAREVLINDSHSSMRNLDWEDLPDDVRMIAGNRKPFSMAQGIDETFGAAFFTGYHAPIGAADGALDHTYSPGSLYNVFINGVACSEATINAALIGHFGVPVVLITGDRTTIEHAKSQMPWITGVVVKESYGHYCVNSISPGAARASIGAGAREALANVASAKPFVFEPPITLEIDTVGTEHADFMEMIPGFQRTGGRRVRFVHDDYPTLFKAYICAYRLGYLASEQA